MAQDMLIQHLLKRLRLPTMGHQYRKLAQEAAAENKPYEDFLLRLLEMEVTHREENTQKRLIDQARFPYLRTLDQFDFSAMPSVNKAKVLELAKGEYLAKRENVAMMGNMGTGKTHVAISLGLMACRQGKKVRFVTATGLINDLVEAQEQHTLGRRLAQLQKLDLLILDEVGFVPFTTDGARLLFQVCSDRYIKGSLIVTTNLEFSRWAEVFGDERLTGALLDRFTHHCHILEFNGDSYRFRESLRRQESGG
ncbi:MAG: IS21-like element helper ATPase IstB [Chloroflexi bacterium]|nr:IS21-like element helper ATPase IstB [Chloroflexota bacterium]